MIKLLLTIAIVLWPSSTVSPNFMIEEDIKIYKQRCEKIYPIASLRHEPETNYLIITWKDGSVSRRSK